MNNENLNHIKVVLVEYRRINKWLDEQLRKGSVTIIVLNAK